MTHEIHFDPRAVRPVTGGVVVHFDSMHLPTRVEVIETAAVVTLTIFDEGGARKLRHRRHARREVFIPLLGPLACRPVIDGSMARAPELAVAAA
jgi:hypothetical protein